ncbi:MAG: glycoside hydrolase family 75 protein [Verrucomicrobiota bacterium]
MPPIAAQLPSFRDSAAFWFRPLLGLLVISISTGCQKKLQQPPDHSDTPVPPTPETPVVPAPPPPLPTIPYKRLDTTRLFSGIQVKTHFQADIGTTATTERQDPSSYELDLQLRVRVPKPHQSLSELVKLNPDLPLILPSLQSMVSNGKVSPLYEELYQRKVANLQTNLNRLDSLLSRHNFFDTETILEMEHSETHRKVILVQADMDVDTDGSDGDRVATMDGVSSTFQPFTSYKWPKVTKKPNPFLATWEKRLKDNEKELSAPNLAASRQKELKDQQNELKLELAELKTKSFLVGSADPFVVLPLPMVSRKGGAPIAQIGDFCVIIHDKRLFPAVVGDAGPSYKSGEASLRVCREIAAKASSGMRPESDLKVTYLVFPGTATNPRVAPNLEQWWTRCDSLLQELGGYNGELFFFEDLTKPKYPPAPAVGDPNFIGPAPEFLGPPWPAEARGKHETR